MTQIWGLSMLQEWTGEKGQTELRTAIEEVPFCSGSQRATMQCYHGRCMLYGVHGCTMRLQYGSPSPALPSHLPRSWKTRNASRKACIAWLRLGMPSASIQL